MPDEFDDHVILSTREGMAIRFDDQVVVVTGAFMWA